VIVADNASTDDTGAIALARGCRVAIVNKRIIGASRNGGAALATAPISASSTPTCRFTPIPSTPSPTRSPIRRSSAAHRRHDGALVGRHRVTYAMILPLVWLTNMDTGVVFMRRDDFVKTGGYPENRHYAEDIAFLWKLIRLGRSTKQRMTRLRAFKSIALDAQVRSLRRLALLLVDAAADDGTLLARRSNSAQARDYWYNDR
jgi:hypothetical protein